MTQVSRWIYTTERGLAFQMARNHIQASMWWPLRETLCFLGDLVSIATGRIHFDDTDRA